MKTQTRDKKGKKNETKMAETKVVNFKKSITFTEKHKRQEDNKEIRNKKVKTKKILLTQKDKKYTKEKTEVETDSKGKTIGQKYKIKKKAFQ